MGNMTIYFNDTDDYLRRWFKETYRGNASGIITDYIRRLYDSNGEAAAGGDDPADRARTKLKAVFSDVTDSGTEAAWLAEMHYTRMSGADIVHRRLSEFKTRNPELAKYAEDEFQKLYPVLAKAGGITE